MRFVARSIAVERVILKSSEKTAESGYECLPGVTLKTEAARAFSAAGAICREYCQTIRLFPLWRDQEKRNWPSESGRSGRGHRVGMVPEPGTCRRMPSIPIGCRFCFNTWQMDLKSAHRSSESDARRMHSSARAI